MHQEFRLSAEDFGRVRLLISSERQPFGNALATHVNEFFREEHHFAELAERARAMARRGAPVKVWCCACSTGEESYSAAMALSEVGCAGEILATDVNTEALAAARRGIYALEAVEKVGGERLRKHFFVRGEGDGGQLALVRTELRAMVRFEQRNLLDPRWPAAERFDFVFCRNVLTSFDRASQRRLLDRLATAIEPDGMLFLGHGEAGALGHPSFVPCGKTSYLRFGPNP